MITDPIADYLTRIRNAQSANHKIVSIPYSNSKKEISKILVDNGYIRAFKIDEKDNKKNIKIALKYNLRNNSPVIVSIKRKSKPGLRVYSKANEIPKVINGLGILIMSTSKGIITDKQARKYGVGGELLCEVY